MKLTISSRKAWIAGITLLVCICVASNADAQTRRRRTTTGSVAPIVTSTPVDDNAQVIRTADQNDAAAYVTPGDPVQAEVPADPNAQKVKDLTSRVKKLEAVKTDPYEDKQKRMLLNLDILTRSEQRSESLRKQVFDMIEKENTIKSRLDQIEYDIRPEMINRAATYAGTMRPEEVRDMRKKSLDAEKTNLQTLLNEIQSTRTSLAANLERSDALVEKLRSKLEKDIDDSFMKDQPDQ